MIDLTLDSILVPDITGYTPPFGTKIARTAVNKGGLSTQQVHNNIIAGFVKMRGVVVDTSDTTSSVEYDAKIIIEASEAITLTLAAASYRGCKVTIVNNTSYTHTLSCTSVSTNTPHILPNADIEIMWNGNAWKSLSAPAVGKRVTQFPQEEPPSTTYPCTKWELMSFDGAFFRAEGTNAAAFIEKTDVLSAQGDQNKSHAHGMNNHTHSGSTTGAGAHTHAMMVYQRNSSWSMDLAIGRSSSNQGGLMNGWHGDRSYDYHTCNIHDNHWQNDLIPGDTINRNDNAYGYSATNAHGRYFAAIAPSHTHNFTTGAPSSNTSDTSGGNESRPKNYTVRIWKRIA